MEQDRYQEFVDRIQAATDDIHNHFMEHPLLSHYLRLADIINTLFIFRWCPENRSHWNCIVPTSNITRKLFTLVLVRPEILDEILAEFGDDFKNLVPEKFLHYAAAEYRGYPIPPEMMTFGQEEVKADEPGEDGSRPA